MAYDLELLSGARVLWSEVGVDLPSIDDVDYGADATAWDSTGTAWHDVGYTNKPTAIGYTSETYDVRAEQSTLPIDTIVTSENAPISVGIISWNAANLALAFPGASATPQVADATHKASTIIKFGGAAARDTYQWCIEGGKKDADNVIQPQRFFIYKGQAVLDGDISITASAETAINLTITAIEDTSKPVGERLGEIHIVTGGMTE